MNGEILRRPVTIVNPHGLHMRPATAFAKRAESFPGTVTVAKGDQRVDGKSLWDLLLLGAEQGTELVLEVCGDDAAAVLDSLVEILSAPVPDEPGGAAISNQP
jgi:phosphotransferase system HPr (HPr) family protein